MTRILFGFYVAFLFVGGLPADEKGKSSFVVAPTVTSSPGFGNGLGAVGLYFFRPDTSDTVSPNSLLTLVGLYSDTDSYFTGAFLPLYLAEDRWRVTPGAVRGRTRSELEVGLPEAARFDTDFRGGFLKALRQVTGDWYAGGQIMLMDNQYEARNTAGEAYFSAFEIEDTVSGTLSAVIAYDSRDDQRYPTRGQNGEMSLSYAPEAWTEEGSYTTSQLQAATFHSLSEAQVLAGQLYAKTVSEDAPYFERPTLGQRGDLRGYTPGEIVGDHSVSLQVELRTFFTERWGGVVFCGVGAIWEDGLTSDDLYPSYGAGIRFRLQEANNVNFRIDYALGEDDEDGWYVSVSEAF